MKSSVIKYRIRVFIYQLFIKSRLDGCYKVDAAKKASPYNQMNHNARIDALFRYLRAQ